MITYYQIPECVYVWPIYKVITPVVEETLDLVIYLDHTFQQVAYGKVLDQPRTTILPWKVSRLLQCYFRDSYSKVPLDNLRVVIFPVHTRQQEGLLGFCVKKGVLLEL
jgi:hypothetical protein